MKHLKLYNEAVVDFLKPKSKEEIIASLTKNSPTPEDRLENIFHYQFQNLFNDEELKKFVMDIEPDKRIYYMNDYKLQRLFNDEEMHNLILEMDPSKILEHEFRNKSLKGVKYVLDNYRLYGKDTKNAISVFIPFIENKEDMKFLLSNEQIVKFLNPEQIYVLKKYILGEHQNEEHDYEKEIIFTIDNGFYYKSDDDPNVMICKIDDQNLFNYNKLTKKLVYHLDNLGKFLRIDREDWTGKGIHGFSFKWNETIIKGIVQKMYNIEIKEIDGSRNDSHSFVKK